MANIVCYDLDGDIVEHLTQWDHGLTLVIDGIDSDPMPEFRYSNRNSKESIPVDSYRSGAHVCARLPDELLQEPLPITVQLFYERQGSKTRYAFIIPVAPAKRPADYKYMPTDGKTWDDVEAALRRDMALKISAPGTATVGEYLRVKTVNIDGTIEVESAPAGSATIPVATSTALGGVKPVAKTSAMTQPVGVDGNGRLYTAPSGSTVSIDTSLSKSGQAADAKIVGDALAEIEAALGSYISDIDALIGGGN